MSAAKLLALIVVAVVIYYGVTAVLYAYALRELELYG
jgi:hypothetical protein